MSQQDKEHWKVEQEVKVSKVKDEDNSWIVIVLIVLGLLAAASGGG